MRPDRRPIVGVLAPQGKARRPVSRLLPTWVRPRLIYPDAPPRARGRLDAVINWGCSTAPDWWHFSPMDARVLNPPALIHGSKNKLEAFNSMEIARRAFGVTSVLTVPFTASRDTAGEWLARGHTVFARTVLTGHSGRGIVIVRPGDDIPPAPLYTQAVRRRGLREFRVYFGGTEVLDVAIKRKRTDYAGEVDPMVRSWHGGWIFSRTMPRAGRPPEELLRSIVAVGASTLQWGAIDVLVDTYDYSRPAYVLEVNSRPGIDDSRTRAAYAGFFNTWLTATLQSFVRR